MIRVFITDDHEIYLEGLSLLLSKQDGRSDRYGRNRQRAPGSGTRSSSRYLIARRLFARPWGGRDTAADQKSPPRSSDHLPHTPARHAIHPQTVQIQHSGLCFEERLIGRITTSP